MKTFTTLSTLAVLASSATAHFSITHPTALTTSSTANGPCGGATISLDTTTDFFVGGEAVAIKTGHPEVHILIRGTLDPTASGNWTNLFPVVKQEGLGTFCEPGVTAPESWAGKEGFVQVIESGEDGLLYACSAVTFRANAAVSTTTLCSNGTGVTGTFDADSSLPSDGLDFSGAASTDTESSTASSTTEAAAASSTEAESAAVKYGAGLGVVGAAVMGLVLMV